MSTPKKVIWLGDTLKQLRQFPEAVKDQVGYALHKVQLGLMPAQVKQLKGLKPAVMELICNYQTDTYRAVYTVKLDEVVYVLHCFQKKSSQGIKTPTSTMDLIKQRLNDAKSITQKLVKEASS